MNNKVKRLFECVRCVEVDGTVLGDVKIRKKLSWKYGKKKHLSQLKISSCYVFVHCSKDSLRTEKSRVSKDVRALFEPFFFCEFYISF